MWGYLVPYLLHDTPDPVTGKARAPYNILMHSQRGHGKSSLPPDPTTIPSLACDIMHLLSCLNIPVPVQAIVGVSQGGAAALAFSQMYTDQTRSVVACDTSAKTPSGNREAWARRIGMVYGDVSADAILEEGVKDGKVSKCAEYATKVGMGKLAATTVSRWFPATSRCADESGERANRAQWLREMVERTPVDGFVAGAGALSDYDLVDGQLSRTIGFSFLTIFLFPGNQSSSLYESPIEHVLLIAGSLDGNGAVGNGMRRLAEDWNAKRSVGRPVCFQEITGAGHLPMIDETEKFAEMLSGLLSRL
jgi:pimeloyl-ACP methyl ester carboxylesterase